MRSLPNSVYRINEARPAVSRRPGLRLELLLSQECIQLALDFCYIFVNTGILHGLNGLGVFGFKVHKAGFQLDEVLLCHFDQPGFDFLDVLRC